MCGRDLIAVAETGSGKTLAYALPLVRHVLSVKRQYKEYLAKQKEEKLLSLQRHAESQQQQASPGDARPTSSAMDSTAEGKAKQHGSQQAQDSEDKDRFRKNEKGERMLIYGNFKEGMIGLVWEFSVSSGPLASIISYQRTVALLGRLLNFAASCSTLIVALLPTVSCRKFFAALVFTTSFEPQVIAPTRELSLQISKEVSRLCKLVDLSVGSLYGGAGIGG